MNLATLRAVVFFYYINHTIFFRYLSAILWTKAIFFFCLRARALGVIERDTLIPINNCFFLVFGNRSPICPFMMSV